MRRRLQGTLCVVMLALAAPAWSGDEPGPIQDNSFLIEEAYNQDPGVVQHIGTFLRERDGSWAASFTQEWPFHGLRHQLSYSVPFLALPDATGERAHGFGDVALNYRFQAVGNADARFAFAPRATLLLPTGDEKNGRGQGGAGLQINLPASYRLADHLIAHSNAGVTYTPNSRFSADVEESATVFNLGQSVIWETAPRFNVMLELVWVRGETLLRDDRKGWESQVLLSPGIRWAWNFASGLQIVPGLAVPIGIGPSDGDHGVFVYLSFEHPFRKK